jgi:hypothetical protein
MRTRTAVSIVSVAAWTVVASAVSAAEPSPLARARTLYNATDYDGAIEAAAMARTLPSMADAAAVVEARARLERYRHNPDPMDLVDARAALNAVHVAVLSPRDHVDLLIGLGLALYLSDLFGPAADVFDTALERSMVLPERDRMMLLDWWATAMDREAQGAAVERRARLAKQIETRMGEELRRDPGNAPANYWRAVAARAAGDADMAWDAAVAAWVRAPLSGASAQLRADIDRLVLDAIIPERVRSRPVREQDDAGDAMRAQWEMIKSDWR